MTTTFFGIPVSGEIQRGTKKANQRPVEEFGPILQKVLEDPLLGKVAWHQYTPYFNDGDECVFGVLGLYVVPANVVNDHDIENFYWPYGELFQALYGKAEYEWVRGGSRSKRVLTGFEGPNKDGFIAIQALADALESDEFDDALLEAFGDHAFVMVSRTGIDVDFYEHD